MLMVALTHKRTAMAMVSAMLLISAQTPRWAQLWGLMAAPFQTGHQKIRGIVKMETGLGFEMTMALEIITMKTTTV